MMISALNTAAAGLLSAQKDANDAAVKIVTSSAESLNESGPSTIENPAGGRGTIDLSATPIPYESSLIESIVDLKTAKISFEANAKVFSELDEMTGKFLDDLK